MRIRIDGDGDFELPDVDGARIKDNAAAGGDPGPLVEEVRRIGTRAVSSGEPDLVFADAQLGEFDVVMSDDADGRDADWDTYEAEPWADNQPSVGVEDTDRRFG